MKLFLSENKSGGIPMSRFFFVTLLALFVLTGVQAAPAEQTAKIPRIGFLVASSRSVNAAREEAFRFGLRQLGYVDGKSIVIEWRAADGKFERLPALAGELVQLKVDAIVTAGTADTKAAREATRAIPIVMTYDNDPVANGFVASLAHPGGNITGLSTLAPELSGKRLELLKEIFPKLSRVAIFNSPKEPGSTILLEEAQHAADVFKIKLQILDVLNAKDIEPAFRAASKVNAEAIVVGGGALFSLERKQLAELAIKFRLPAMNRTGENVEDGGLVSYGVNRNDLVRRAATYVDRILKGAKPGDLPVEQPVKFEFIINLKAAKQIGVTIPPNVLARADRVIR
jgi:ABC-type uncharacterized transport system substrate-binding protein